MKQIFQNLKDGKIILDEVPVPNVDSNSVLVKTEKSLISSGTERSLIDFGKSNYLQKAKRDLIKLKRFFKKLKQTE